MIIVKEFNKKLKVKTFSFFKKDTHTELYKVITVYILLIPVFRIYKLIDSNI